MFFIGVTHGQENANATPDGMVQLVLVPVQHTHMVKDAENSAPVKMVHFAVLWMDLVNADQVSVSPDNKVDLQYL